MTPEDKLKAVINKHVGHAEQEVYDAIDEYAQSMYSEGKVIKLLQLYRFDLSSGETPVVGDTTSNWFNNNKK